MDNYLIIFSIFLLCILVALIAFLCFLAMRLIKQRENEEFSKETSTPKEEAKFCVNHPDVMTLAECSIDMKPYCEECLVKVDEIKIAKTNVAEYSSYEWKEILMVKNGSSFDDLLGRIRSVKEKFWEQARKPLIIRGHYKIDVETDNIEAFTVLLCRKEDESVFQAEMSFIK